MCIRDRLQIEASDKVIVQSVVPEPKLTPAITAAVCRTSFVIVGAGIFHCYNSCLTAWPKFKTAIPLLYTVYRTRNRKQEGSDWEKVSFEAVSKNSRR